MADPTPKLSDLDIKRAQALKELDNERVDLAKKLLNTIEDREDVEDRIAKATGKQTDLAIKLGKEQRDFSRFIEERNKNESAFQKEKLKYYNDLSTLMAKTKAEGNMDEWNKLRSAQRKGDKGRLGDEGLALRNAEQELLKVKEEEFKVNIKLLESEVAREKQFSGVNSLAEKLGLENNRIFVTTKKIIVAMESWKAILEFGIIAALTMSVGRFFDLDKAAGEFRKTTGLTVPQMAEIAKAARETNVQYAQFGIGITEALSAAADLSIIFQTTALVTKDMIGFTSLLAANIGVATEDSSKILQMYEGIAQTSGTTAKNLEAMAVAFASKADVSTKQVFEDMARASNETLIFLAKNPIQLMRTTIEARRAGTSIDSMSKSAHGFLNFQDSITSEMEASALLGKSVNFQLSRQLAYEGDIAGSRKAALDQIKKIGDFSKLGPYQQERLAAASQMTVQEITTQLSQEKALNALRAKDPTNKRLAEYNAINEALKNATAETQDKLAQDGLDLIQTRLRQTMYENMTNQLKRAFTSMADVLLPIADQILPAVLDIITGISAAIGWISSKLRVVNRDTNETESLWRRILRDVVVAGLGAAVFFKLFTGVFSGIGGKVSSLFEKIPGGGIFSKIFGGGQGTPPVLGQVKNATSIFDKIKGIVTGTIDVVKAALVGVAKTIGETFQALAKGIATGIGYFGKPNVLLGVAAMAGMAGGLWILGKALQQFSGLDWVSLGKAGVSLAGIATAAAILGIPAVAALVGLGALVIAGLGAALIPFAFAANLAGKAMGPLSAGLSALVTPMKDIIAPFSTLAVSAPGLFIAAGGIGAIAAAMAAFGVGGGIGAIIGKLTGGDGMIAQITALGSLGPALNETAQALERIATAINKIKDVGQVDVGYLAKVVNTAPAYTPTPPTAPADGNVEGKLDAILNALVGGKVAVYMDGRLVSRTLATAAGR